MNFAKGAHSWILTSLIIMILSLILTLLSTGAIQALLTFTTFLLILLSGTFIIFFRDPERHIGEGIVSPADGLIREITHTVDPDIGECTKISIFMNIQNVHVNRMPIDGEIIKMTHRPGGHIPAFKKESERNELVETIIKTPEGPTIKILQIAGAVARRIVSYHEIGARLHKGERFGLIRLGSRVDLYLPDTLKIETTVNLRQHVKAGETNLARIDALSA